MSGFKEEYSQQPLQFFPITISAGYAKRKIQVAKNQILTYNKEIIINCADFISVSNEPSSHACMDIWRCCAPVAHV